MYWRDRAAAIGIAEKPAHLSMKDGGRMRDGFAKPLVLTFVAALAWTAVADAQNQLQWVAATNGAVPAGAVPYGRGADGQPEYVCRAAFGGGMHLGEVGVGATGCSVGYRGRAINVASYEVLASPTPSATLGKKPLAAIEAARAASSVERPIQLQPSAPPAAVPPTPADSSTKRGFDEKGRPYVDVRLADGTVKRTQEAGVTLFKPDGTSQFIPRNVIRSNAQPPTPPALPSDPREGRTWVERHNQALFDLISNMVAGDAVEMKKFTDAEQQVAGDDLFQQIVYRTNIAGFLATSR